MTRYSARYPVRKARVEAERLARAPHVRSSRWWVRLTPLLAEQLEAERARYFKRPSKAEVVGASVLEEGLLFREMHRPSTTPKKAKRIPYPIKV